MTPTKAEELSDWLFAFASGKAESIMLCRAAAELRRLSAERDALRADAERLDWLESQREAYGFQDIHEGNRWSVEGPFANVREAIDAAMKGTQA